MERRSKVAANLRVRGDPAGLSHDIQEQLFLIAQEALTNALRHADATTIGVDLRVSEDAVTLTVRDNGSGFDPAAAEQGIGLSTMRERAESVGGRLALRSTRGKGTTVEVVVLLRR